MMGLIVLLCLLHLGAENLAARELAPQQKSRSKRTRVAIPVMFDSVKVYVALGVDSLAAATEAERVQTTLAQLRAHAATPEKIRLRESRYNGSGIILLDSLEVLEIRHENRADPELSPLANALALYNRLASIPMPPPPETSWNEEELLLRLLLGVIYPFSLLVVLRLTRTGIRRWEHNWRNAALQWMNRLAERPGLSKHDFRGRRLVNFLAGIERLFLYGAVFTLLSFTWFALFPQTQPLATSLLARIIGPAIDIIGGTARGLLLLGYTLLVVLLAYWITRYLSQRRTLSAAPTLLTDPVIYFPLRLTIWIVALFLILFPYPGAPRLFAVGVLLIALLTALIALRPIVEEIAAGIYINGAYAFKTGDQMTLDGTPYVVVAPSLVHLFVLRGEEKHWMPYSRILKADVAIASLVQQPRMSAS